MKTSTTTPRRACTLVAASLAMSLAVCLPTPALADCPAYVKHDPGGDYTNPTDRQGLQVVESFHFTPKVESLSQGATGAIGADISYTLEHFPNHHRALAAIAKLGLRDKKNQPVGARYTIDCYFDRAIRFRNDDATVRQVYGSYLLGAGQDAAALLQLQEAARLAPEHPTVNYNLGLMYFKKKDYQQARDYAWKAYGLGFPLPGLKNKLAAAGQWQEAPQ